MKNACGKSPDGEYLRVVRNLYVVPTPVLTDANESEIEDFFDTTTKETIIGGKTFSNAKDFDSTKHYGKKIFAYSVVERDAKSINFDGFRPLLNTFSTVISAHAKTMAEAKSNGEG